MKGLGQVGDPGTVASVCLVAAAPFVLATCGPSQVSNVFKNTSVGISSPSAAPARTPGVHPRPTVARSPKPQPRLGALLHLTGQAGTPELVSADSVIDPAQGDSIAVVPSPGDRFVAAVFTVSNGGTTTLVDDADNDAALVGSDGLTYSPDLSAILVQCDRFGVGGSSAYIALAPGSVSNACVGFELPNSVRVAKVLWLPASGYGGGRGVWSVR